MILLFLGSLFIVPLLAAAQNTLDPTVLCVPGQCLQGYSSVTLGAKLSCPASPVPLHLLPGQYTSTTNPQLLHDCLTSSTLTPSAGFTNGSLSLPLDLSLQPGLVIFSDRLYAGQAAFTTLPNSTPNPNTSTPLDAQSLVLSSNVLVIATSSSNRVILWDSVPDTHNLPSSLNNVQLSLVDIQSTTCSPSCSTGGICSPQGQCVCRDGFAGSSCEDCAPGHFGPNCQACETGCDRCDEGVSGTGRCLKQSGGGNSCNCLSGVCGPDGNCQCIAGFVKADNGTQCAKCADNFFLTSTGDCKACQVGCKQCADGTGVCLACNSGFSQNPNDQTKCIPPKQVTSTGSQCPELAFASGSSCTPCASPCQSCSGGTSNDCTACVRGMYMLNGVCVSANSDGVCEGTNLIADNNKKACDNCGAKCTSCKLPNFSIASIVNDLQCTGCVPGSFLSNGKCVDSCPSGTFVSPQDNMTCKPCDSSCSTCSGSSTFCLICSSQTQLAFNGKCFGASSCPKSTFASPSASSCISCHPDCVDCSGTSFNKCTACPPERPVLSNGRCMPTCAKNEYWDGSANACRGCDSSCGSCSGPGSSSCLSCSNANDRVLRSGSCVASSDACSSSGNITIVINPLGACFSELIKVPTPSGTGELAPMPTVTGIDQPTTVAHARKLEWWQILLMALGCAFIFLVFIWCCRRRIRKRKERERHRVQAYAFANSRNNKSSWWGCAGKRDKSYHAHAYHPDLDRGEIIQTGSSRWDKNGWKWRLIRVGEKFFGHSKSTRVYPPDHSMEMGPTVRGKSIVMLSDPSSHPNDAKYYSPFHSHSHSHSHSPSHCHSHSHSHSRSKTHTSPFRDIDIERGASPFGQASPRSRPIRPPRSSDGHSLDVHIDVGSSEGQFDHYDQHDRHGHDLFRDRGRGGREEDGEEADMVQLISSYRYTTNPKTPPATKDNFHHGSRSSTPQSHHSNGSRAHLLAHSPPHRNHSREPSSERNEYDEYHDEEHFTRSRSSISTDSMYSQMTGHTRRMPEVRQPVHDDVPPVPVLKSKFSMSTIGVGDDRDERRRLYGHGKLKKKAAGGLFWK